MPEIHSNLLEMTRINSVKALLWSFRKPVAFLVSLISPQGASDEAFVENSR